MCARPISITHSSISFGSRGSPLTPPSSSTPRKIWPPSRFKRATISLAKLLGCTSSRLNSIPEFSPFSMISRSSVFVMNHPPINAQNGYRCFLIDYSSIRFLPPARFWQFAFPAPAVFVGAPFGAVGDSFIQILLCKNIGGQKPRFLDGGDVYSHPIIDARGLVKGLTADVIKQPSNNGMARNLLICKLLCADTSGAGRNGGGPIQEPPLSLC